MSARRHGSLAPIARLGAAFAFLVAACGSEYGDTNGETQRAPAFSDAGPRDGNAGATDAGTGNARTDGGPNADGGSTTSSVVGDYVQAVRARNARCTGGNDYLFTGEDKDIDVLIEELDAPGVRPEKKVALATCTLSLATAPCGGMTPECLAYEQMRGRLGAEAGCEYDVQCASGTCSGGDRLHCGKCLSAGAQLGEFCTGARGCNEGLVCLSDGSTPHPQYACYAQTLVKTAGEPCDAKSICGAGLTCACRPGATCTFGSGPFTCQVLLGPGATCSGGSYQAACDQGGTYECSPSTHQCTKRPTAGETCDTTYNNCASGLICPASTGTCRAPRTGIPGGAVCVAGELCAVGFACTKPVPPSRVCEPELTIGQDCNPAHGTAKCGSGLFCDASQLCAQGVTPAACASP